jgi:hypothetical protein
MRPFSLGVKLGGLGLAAAGLVLLHHGHIAIFLERISDSFARHLPTRLRGGNVRVLPSLIQVDFGDPSVHYEVWVQRKTRAIEIGLHFEGERERNQRWAEALAARAPEIQSQLGPQSEVEQWTRKWTRLHETVPIAGAEWRPKESLTPELADETSRRLARYIAVLQPIVTKERRRVEG